MATSRTGTGKWKNIAKQRRHRAQQEGLTHCPECSTLLDWEQGRTPSSAEVDHIIPHAHGGPDTLDNTRIVCRRCNQSLGAKQWLNKKKAEHDATTAPIQTTTIIDW